jgi:hypothetical protein
MKPRILLVNPPIYDFSAYDFWLKPYGLLSIAGYMRAAADFELFDFLDRQHPYMAKNPKCRSNKMGLGHFAGEKNDKPVQFAGIPRYYRRFGLPREMFRQFLAESKQFDIVLIQTSMTYWYQGLTEVIEDIRNSHGQAKIILGGNYATLCAEHARKLAADLVIEGIDLKPLWDYLNIEPDLSEPGMWDLYPKLETGVLKLTDGCPQRCTYCSVPLVYGGFHARSMQRNIAELKLLTELGARHVAFYDDSLLCKSEQVFLPFLRETKKLGIKVNFHTPNALNARFITDKIATQMVDAGFKTFYLGFESASSKWQQKTGGKVTSSELAQAVDSLKRAGAETTRITAYQIIGHPDSDLQQLEASMRFVASLGIRGTLADYSPIPGTPDGERCRKYVDIDEPLMHNKCVFGSILLGFDTVNRLKDMQRMLNGQIC